MLIARDSSASNAQTQKKRLTMQKIKLQRKEYVMFVISAVKNKKVTILENLSGIVLESLKNAKKCYQYLMKTDSSLAFLLLGEKL